MFGLFGGVPQITVQELKEKIEQGDDFLLLDVREPEEYEIANLGGHLIPLAELPHRLEELEAYRDKPIFIYCRTGSRSAMATQWLRELGYDAYNVAGGLYAWSEEINPAMAQY